MTPQEASEELKEEFEIFKNCIHKADWENPDEELKKIIEANTMAIEILGQQPCEDCISRQDVIDAVRKNTFRLTFAEEQGCEGHVLWSAKAVPSDAIEEILLELPSVTPQPKTGKWIFHKPFDNGHKNCNECIECSQCHTWFGHDCYEKTPYCPNCGAKMEGESKTEQELAYTDQDTLMSAT